MQSINRILVGVDLSQSDPPGSSTFSQPVHAAVQHSLWLAKAKSATITFFASLEPIHASPAVYWSPYSEWESTLRKAADGVLAELVQRAAEEGVAAKACIASGPAWHEITRHALLHHDDLVIVGTRNRGAVSRLLFGSTAMRLLRKCPCALWVTKPAPLAAVQNILVASDLTDVSTKALHFAVEIAAPVGAKVHLMHALYDPLAPVWTTRYSDPAAVRHYELLRASARKLLEAQAAGVTGLKAGVQIEIVEGAQVPDHAIVHFIETHRIDLVAIGTIARAGAHGLFVGNTAECLFPQLSCSLLAVKPDGFCSPVAVETAEAVKTE